MIGHPVLARVASQGVRLGLERIEDFLSFVGAPHRCAPVVHVAGTNGKGSVCTMVTAALVAAGLRVGTNLSPHLQHVNERFQLDGQPISDAALHALLEHVDALRRAWASARGLEGEPLTYFELCTAAAFVAFAQAGVDVMVIEVGLGGRLDATNVVHPAVCAITSIGRDHVAELGEDLAGIAREKAGILKAGVPAVIGVVPPEALAAIEDRARTVGAPLWRVGGEVVVAAAGVRTPEGSVTGISLALPGAHQVLNAAVAVGVLHQLRRQGVPVSDHAVRAGLAAARIAGRVERVAPDLVLDGAHNAQGTEALAHWLRHQPRPARRTLIFGMGDERDPVEILRPLVGLADRIVTTSCAHPKARPAQDLADLLRAGGIAVEVGGPIEPLLPSVRAASDETIVAGSLYLVGAARDALG